MKKILMFLLLIIGIISCGKYTKNQTPEPEKTETTFTINLGEEGKTIDPQLTSSSPSINLLSLVEKGLVSVDEDLNIIPGLAKSWDISEDGLIYTFHLRENLKWSDGSALTAKDFRYGWIRALKAETAAEYAYMLFPIENAEAFNAGKVSADEVGIKALDDLTLQVKLHSPVAFFPSLTAVVTFLPLKEEFYEEHKEDFALEPESLLYCGPYLLKEWVHNSEMTLVKNPDYFNAENIKIDKIIIKYIPDSAAKLNAFENNELDIVTITAEQFEKYKDDPRIVKKPQSYVSFMLFNTQVPALSSPKVRAAISLAIDKEDFVETIFRGTATPAYSLTPAGVGMRGVNGDFVEEMGRKIPKHNLELARQLLKEGLAEVGLKEMPEISLLANLTAANKKVAEVIQEDLRRNLGITLNIEGKEYKERLARMNTGNFDITLAGWGADYQDPMTFLDLFVSNSGNNKGKYSNPEYDRLVEAARTEVDTAKRVGYMQRMEEIIASEYPVAPLYTGGYIYLKNPKVKGLVYSSFGPRFFVESASIEN